MFIFCQAVSRAAAAWERPWIWRFCASCLPAAKKRQRFSGMLWMRRKFQTFRICGNYRRRSMRRSKSCRRSASIPQEESWNGWRSTRKQSRDIAMCRSCTACIRPIRSRWIKHQSLPPRLRKPCVYALQTAAATRAGAGHGSSIFMRSCGMVKKRGRTFARCWQNPPMPIFLTATRRSR